MNRPGPRPALVSTRAEPITPTPRPNIELHIEELVLHGFAPADREGIGAAIQAELVRLLAERGTPPSLLAGGTLERLDGGAFHMDPGARSESVGAQVASAVYGGLER